MWINVYRNVNSHWINMKPKWTIFCRSILDICDNKRRTLKDKQITSYIIICVIFPAHCVNHPSIRSLSQSASRAVNDSYRENVNTCLLFDRKIQCAFGFRMWRTGISDSRVTCNWRLCKPKTPQGNSRFCVKYKQVTHARHHLRRNSSHYQARWKWVMHSILRKNFHEFSSSHLPRSNHGTSHG